ncbi:GroEL equatorial domain-like protein [Coprinopsis marcescibilis]|uniref:GroEL equatorial domain-like protein n=1 Tax=Coprinopsis marcescibilis TaxID=230819 RepID=A0A5C3KGB3_COPMA|nr:GroEL equatorial domain-like protein [Coprinopsis marcescibilis]
MINKDITHPNMRRLIKNPRIILLDCPLEYEKGESQTNMEFSKADNWARAQETEEEQVKALCYKLLELKPDLIIAENGVSISLNTCLNAPTCPASAVSTRRTTTVLLSLSVRPSSTESKISGKRTLEPSVVFSKSRKSETNTLTSLVECTSPKACAVLPRGPFKDILNEIDRNVADAMSVARSVVFNPRLAPGGGATEMATSVGLQAKAKSIVGADNTPFRAVADGTVGGNAMRVLAELKAKHVAGENTWGLDGNSGKNVDMKEYGWWESASVKIQTFKTAIKAARMLLRIDDVVEAIRKEREQTQPMPEDMQNE